MMMYDCFYVTLATLIEPDNYKQEFLVAKRVLYYLTEMYPEIEEDMWKNGVLTSYKLHREHLSVKGRVDHMKGIVFCAGYSNRIDDRMKEQKRRNQDYQMIYGKKPSKHMKLAIAEFTSQQFIDQMEEDAKILLYTPPATYIPQ